MLREQVAEAIDPEAWGRKATLLKVCLAHGTGIEAAESIAFWEHEAVRERLLAKADAIIPIVLEAAARVAEEWTPQRYDDTEIVAIDIATAIRKMGGERG